MPEPTVAPVVPPTETPAPAPIEGKTLVTETPAPAPETPEAKAAAETKAKEEAEAAAKTEAERVAKLTPEQKAEEEKAAKAKAEAEAKNKVPESYKFVAPEGTVLDDKVVGDFSAWAKKNNLSQEAAQEAYDIGAKIMLNQKSSVAAAQRSWREAAMADSEIGGDDATRGKNLSVAKRALQFATPELKTILEESKLGDHPEMIRWMFRVGKAMGEDTFVPGRSIVPAPNSEEARAKRLYPNQN